MFGQNNDQDQQNDQQIPDQAIDAALQDDQQQVQVAPPAPAGDDWQHPGTPIDDQAGQTVTPTEPAAPVEPVQHDQVSDQPVEHHDTPVEGPVNNELIDIKQKALSQLSPLVGHLDQAPEEKFRTTMMMIQASDDQSLINTAYEAANQIPDEKAKAQALLDIVNEINYFTQPKA